MRFQVALSSRQDENKQEANRMRGLAWEDFKVSMPLGAIMLLRLASTVFRNTLQFADRRTLCLIPRRG